MTRRSTWGSLEEDKSFCQTFTQISTFSLPSIIGQVSIYGVFLVQLIHARQSCGVIGDDTHKLFQALCIGIAYVTAFQVAFVRGISSSVDQVISQAFLTAQNTLILVYLNQIRAIYIVMQLLGLILAILSQKILIIFGFDSSVTKLVFPYILLAWPTLLFIGLAEIERKFQISHDLKWPQAIISLLYLALNIGLLFLVPSNLTKKHENLLQISLVWLATSMLMYFILYYLSKKSSKTKLQNFEISVHQ